MLKSSIIGKVFAVAGIAILFGGVGYVAGRDHVLGPVRDMVMESIRPVSESDIPDGPPRHAYDSSTYSQMNTLLDRRLETQQRESAYWKALLEATDPNEQKEISQLLRAELMKLLEPWPLVEAETQANVEHWYSDNVVDVYLVTLKPFPDVDLQSVLLIPQNFESPRPALVLLHGYGGNLYSIVSDIDYHHGYGMELAKAGYIIIAPFRVASTINTRSTLYTKALASGWSQEGLDLQQIDAVVDYLVSMPEVDDEHVGVYGISLGGGSTP